MTLRLALSLTVMLAASSQLVAKPNVIVIMADDIGFECYSQYGSEFYQTPQIDRLATTGANSRRPIPSRSVRLPASKS